MKVTGLQFVHAVKAAEPRSAGLQPALDVAWQLDSCEKSRLQIGAPVFCGGQAQRDPAFARTEIFRINHISRPPESAVAAPVLPAQSKIVRSKQAGIGQPTRRKDFIPSVV